MPDDKKTQRPRRSISTPATFLSVPQAFAGAEEGLAHAFKFGFQILSSQTLDRPTRLEQGLFVDFALLDLGTAALSSFDLTKMARDCELLRDAFLNSPDQIRKILAAFQPDAPQAEITHAFQLAQELGLTEEAALSQGGGWVPLAIALAALALAACGHVTFSGGPDGPVMTVPIRTVQPPYDAGASDAGAGGM